MNKVELLYQKTQNVPLKKNDEYALEILYEYAVTENIALKENITAQNALAKIIKLLNDGANPKLNTYLQKYHYNYRYELELIIWNLCHGNTINKNNSYLSFSEIKEEKDCFKLNTIYGPTQIKKISKCTNLLNELICPNQCHKVCEEFIRRYPQYSASTAFLKGVFFGQFYHSFINLPSQNAILDLSAGAYMSKADYFLMFNPQIINTVFGYEIDKKIASLAKDESLPESYCNLLRLALEKQVQRTDN